jgi:hypothetical protein
MVKNTPWVENPLFNMAERNRFAFVLRPSHLAVFQRGSNWLTMS